MILGYPDMIDRPGNVDGRFSSTYTLGMSTPTIPTVIPSDPLGEALHSLRMSGTFYSRCEFSAPWALEVPEFEASVMFHVVISGQCWLEVDGEEPTLVRPGDLALVPHGDGHRLASEPGVHAARLFDLPREMVSERYEILRHGGGGAATTLVCGAVRFDHPAAHHLVSVLPGLIRVEAAASPRTDWIQSTVRLMAAEASMLRPGGETVITRLADVMVIQAIRAWIEDDPAARTGWLGALRDRQVGRAITLIHRDPARAWTVATLAAEVAMSRSAFSARFTERVGEPPMHYVTRWRMHVARAALVEEEATLGELTLRLGYGSEAAFSRAFKRFMTAPDLPVQHIGHLLSAHAGMPVTIQMLEPIYGTTVFRCILADPFLDLGDSVIVKRRRPEGEARSEPEMMATEAAALRFLTTNGIRSGPRLIAADTAVGFVVMEDMGEGPSLEDLLFGDDWRAAVDGLIAFGTALGELHAATAGRADAFLAAQGRQGSVPSTWQPVGAFGLGFRSSWERLRSSVEAHSELPPALKLEHDIEAMLEALAPAGPYPAMTNGDPCPANTRFTRGAIRFLDFEQATFHHALLDLTALHLPFPACPCWSVLPDEATAPAIHAWRTAFARYHPGALDDDEYLPGVAAACLAWAILRMAPWTRLDAADEPHPVGFTKRAQRLATIDAAVRVTRRANTLPALTEWLATFSSALRQRWSDTPLTLTILPAFAASRPDLRPGILPPVPDDKGGIRVRARAGA